MLKAEELRVGQVLETKDSVFLQILELPVNKGSFKYVYLNEAMWISNLFGSYSLQDIQDYWLGKDSIVEPKNYAKIKNYHNISVVCQDCQEFCQQKCLIQKL